MAPRRLSWSRSRSREAPEPVPHELAVLIERARLDWLAAQSEFDAVTEPDLVDHAIYAIRAAERRYVYLLRLAARMREGGDRPAPRGAGDRKTPRAAGGSEPVQAGAGSPDARSGSQGLRAS